MPAVSATTLPIQTRKVSDADVLPHSDVGSVGRTVCGAPGMSCWLDAFVRTEIEIGHRSLCAFRICGYAGLAMSVTLAMALCICLKLSILTITGIAAAAIAVFFLLAWLSKIALREERLVYYHHQMALIAVVTAMLWVIDQPILPYLDVTIVGIGTFLVFGRVGCLMVGCCHGRPHRFGVCYREEHAHAGFTACYVGVRLFPIQAVECLWVTGLVAAVVAMIVSRQPAGTALAWYTVGYGLGRFFFEFMRGDASRPYWRGFSEAQWTSTMLVLVVAGLELSRVLPGDPWHVAAAVFLVMIMAVIGITRRLRPTPDYRLLNPRHVHEIVRAVHAVHGREGATPPEDSGNPIFATCPVRDTSLGIRISASQHIEGPVCVQHYAISDREGRMTDAIAKSLASVIFAIERNPGSRELLKGGSGVYHLLVRREAG
jgi:hypothetical protein